MKTRVRQIPTGLDRSRRAGPRAVVALLAMISIPWVLLGATGTTAIASSRDDPGAAHANAQTGEHRDDDPEDPRDRCGRDLRDQPSDRDSDGCGCCDPARRRAVTTPGPPGSPPPAPQPVRARAATETAAHPTIGSPRPLTAAPHVPRDPVDQRPPLLAPPALTVPSPAPPGAVSTTPVSIYVITVSTLLVATAISIAALVLVRRSD